MDKHKKMVQKNKELNKEKEDKAIQAIRYFLNNDKQIVVSQLTKETGLSRTFFYNNKEVNSELKRAQELQDGKSFVAPEKLVIDKAMDKEICLLKKRLTEKDLIIKELKEENEKLKLALNKNTIKLLKDL